MAIHAVEARTLEDRIDEAAAEAERLARRHFGPAAYLLRDVYGDPEAGDLDTIFEVHYCRAHPEHDMERPRELHDAFMDDFVESVSPDILCRIILKSVPTDADPA